MPGLGYALVGFPNAQLPPGLIVPGQPASFAQPANAAFAGVEFEVQSIGLQLSGPLTGGFTHVDRNRMHFD